MASRGWCRKGGKRSTEMKGSISDRAGEMLSALVDDLEVDPTELGKRALKVWRAIACARHTKSRERRESCRHCDSIH